MQKHDVKNASGTSSTQQPNKKTGPDNDLTQGKKPMQKSGSDRINKNDDDLVSPQRSK